MNPSSYNPGPVASTCTRQKSLVRFLLSFLLFFFPSSTSSLQSPLSGLASSVALHAHFPRLTASQVGIQQEVPGSYLAFWPVMVLSQPTVTLPRLKGTKVSVSQVPRLLWLQLITKALSPMSVRPGPLLPAPTVSNFAGWKPGNVVVATVRKGGPRLRPLLISSLTEGNHTPSSCFPNCPRCSCPHRQPSCYNSRVWTGRTDSERSLTERERERRDMGWCELYGSPECDL